MIQGFAVGNTAGGGTGGGITAINVSAGTTSNNLSALTFSNGSNVSFGLNASTITASVATSLTNVNLSAGTTSQNLSRFVFSNSNNVSFGLNGSTITASASAATAQGSINLSAGTTSNMASAFTFSNSNGVSFGLNASTLTASIATSLTNINLSAGTTSNNLSAVTFSNSNNVSFGLNGSTVTATATVASTQGSINLSAGTTSNLASAFTFSNSNNVSFGLNGSTITATATVASTQGSINLSAGTTSNLASAFTFSNSNGVSFGLNSSTITASVATSLTNINVSAGGTSNNLSVLVFSNSNNVTFGLSGSTITASASGGGAGSGLGSIGISTQGNTSGTTGFASVSYQLVGTGAITLNQSTSNNGVFTLSISAPPVSNIVGVDPVSISSAGSTISVQLKSAVELCPYSQLSLVTNSTLGQSSLYFVPFDVNGVVSASRVNFFFSLTHTYSGAPANSTAWWAAGFGLYTRGTGASTDRISQLTTYSMSVVSISVSSSTGLSATHYIGLSNVTSHSTSQYGVNSNTVTSYFANTLAGFRVVAFPLNTTLTAGRYWLGFSNQTSSQGSSAVLGVTVMQQILSNNIAFRPFGVNSAASNASFYAPGLAGSYSAQSAAWPGSIALTTADLRAAPACVIPYFNISGLSTSTNLL